MQATAAGGGEGEEEEGHGACRNKGAPDVGEDVRRPSREGDQGGRGAREEMRGSSA